MLGLFRNRTPECLLFSTRAGFAFETVLGTPPRPALEQTGALCALDLVGSGSNSLPQSAPNPGTKAINPGGLGSKARAKLPTVSLTAPPSTTRDLSMLFHKILVTTGVFSSRPTALTQQEHPLHNA